MHCKTISEFVRAMGGDTALGDKLGLSYNAVMQWRLRGHIASGYHLRLLAMARKKGITVAPEVFGLDIDDVQELSHLFSPNPESTEQHAVTY